MSFYLKDFTTWLVCKMLSDILFLRAGSLRCFCNYHVGRHVENRLKVDKHGSGFFIFSYGVEEKSPYRVGRHVEINLKLIHMASGVKTHTLGAM